MLKGKNAIITGTNRGIGKALLEEFAKNGANVFAHTRKKTPEFLDMIKKMVEKYNVDITPIYFDLTDYDAMKDCVKLIKNSKVQIDVLVNNAGITANSLFQMSTQEILRTQFEVNFFSLFVFTQYISKFMTRQKLGSIINISSMSAKGGDCGRSVYGATKAAVTSLTKTLANELGEYNIRVNSISPGFVETDMMEYLSNEIIQNNIDKTNLKRMAQPKEIAAVAVFLCSDEASYITGQDIRVDGGL